VYAHRGFESHSLRSGPPKRVWNRRRPFLYTLVLHFNVSRLDVALLDEEDPFEIDDQAAHLFKHAALGTEDVYDVWESDPLFYPAHGPADWLMVGEVAGASRSFPWRSRGVQSRRSAGRSAATKRLLA
jgi:hypothetical protein